jgi:hypothetical protein
MELDDGVPVGGVMLNVLPYGALVLAVGIMFGARYLARSYG